MLKKAIKSIREDWIYDSDSQYFFKRLESCIYDYARVSSYEVILSILELNRCMIATFLLIT